MYNGINAAGRGEEEYEYKMVSAHPSAQTVAAGEGVYEPILWAMYSLPSLPPPSPPSPLPPLSLQVDSAYSKGDYVGAHSASRFAKCWSYAGFTCGAVTLVIVFIVVISVKFNAVWKRTPTLFINFLSYENTFLWATIVILPCRSAKILGAIIVSLIDVSTCASLRKAHVLNWLITCKYGVTIPIIAEQKKGTKLEFSWSCCAQASVYFHCHSVHCMTV